MPDNEIPSLLSRTELSEWGSALRQVQQAYPDATLAMRERRQRRSTPVVRVMPPGAGTGRLNAYLES